MRAHRRVIGPCPRCDGEIVERPLSYSCTSWKSKNEPGCGYQIWKQHGRTHHHARGGGRVRRPGRHRRRDRRRWPPSAPSIGPCPTPDCGGEIVEREQELRLHVVEEPHRARLRVRDLEAAARRREDVTVEEAQRAGAHAASSNAAPAPASRSAPARRPAAAARSSRTSRAFGCTSWKSRKEPGCGFVIWKRQRGAAAPRCRASMATEMLRDRQLPGGRPGAAGREPLGPCPTEGCGGTVKSNRAGWGCDSWKSKSSPAAGSPSGASSRVARSRGTRRWHCSSGARPSCPSPRPTPPRPGTAGAV